MTQVASIKKPHNKKGAIIADIVSSLSPFDELERQHIEETLSWIQSGAPLFRIEKPDIPPKHLVTYFILLDEGARKVLLVDHLKAHLWLPSGGHVEVNEHPYETVARECLEELGIEADFWRNDPFFLTVTPTVGLTAGHTDVTLWYVLKGDSKGTYVFDAQEFRAIGWFGFDDIPFEKSDPHMQRFIHKLKIRLSAK